MEIFILLLLRKLLEISGTAFLVLPFAADDCNRGERDGADNGCSDGGRCLIHNDRHDVCARKIRDEGVVRCAGADRTAPRTCENSGTCHGGMHARRDERGNEDAAHCCRAACCAWDGDIDPPCKQHRERDQDKFRPRNDARDRRDEVMVTARQLHDVGEAHNRTDDGNECGMHHGLAERRNGVVGNTADDAHEKPGTEEHHARLIFFDDRNKCEDDNNSSRNSQ